MKNKDDLKFNKNINLSPENAAELSKKFEMLEKKYEYLQEEIAKLPDEQVFDLAKYLESMARAEMDPSMIAQLLEIRLNFHKENG